MTISSLKLTNSHVWYVSNIPVGVLYKYIKQVQLTYFTVMLFGKGKNVTHFQKESLTRGLTRREEKMKLFNIAFKKQKKMCT